MGKAKKPVEPSMKEILDEGYETHKLRFDRALKDAYKEDPDFDPIKVEKDVTEQVHQELMDKYPSYAKKYGNQNLSPQMADHVERPRVQGNPFADIQARNND